MQQPSVGERVQHVLQVAKEKISTALEALNGSGEPSLILRDEGRPIRLEDHERKLSVEAAYIVYGDAEGFLGVFCGFTGAMHESTGEPDRVIIEKAKRVVQELDLMFGSGATNKEARPWLVYLFAVVPGAKEAQDFTQALNSFVLEPYNPLQRIGVSLVTAPEAEEPQTLDRFLAPLLLTTRSITAKDPGDLRAVFNRTLSQQLESCLVGRCGEGTTAQAPATANTSAAVIKQRVLREIVDKLTLSVQQELSIPPCAKRFTSLLAVEGLRDFRRFVTPQALHPKAKNIIFGLNGTGKSSLIQVLELALTGKVSELTDPDAVNPLDSGNQPSALVQFLLNDEDNYPVEQDLRSSPAPLSAAAFPAFCLRQTDYDRFVNCTPEKRSEFLVRALGIPVDRLFKHGLDEMLDKTRQEARIVYPDMKKNGKTYTDAFWDKLKSRLASVFRAESLETTWTGFKRAHQGLKVLFSAYPVLLQKAYDSVQKLTDVTGKWSSQTEEIIMQLKQGPVSQQGLDDAAASIVQVKERTATTLAAVENALHDLADPIRAYLASEVDRPKAEIPAREAIAEKEAKLRRVQYALSSLRSLEPTRDATRDAAAFLEAWWDKLQVLLGTEPPAQDEGAFPAGVHSCILAVRDTAQALAASTPWLEHVQALRELESHLSDPALVAAVEELEKEQRNLSAQVSQLRAALRGAKESTHEPRRKLLAALSACGLQVDESLLTPTSVQALQFYLTALSSLSTALNNLWDQTAWEKISTVILNFYDYPDAAGHMRPGAYYYATYLDELEQKQKDVREAIESWLKSVVNQELEKPFLELLYLLTAFPWGFHYPKLALNVDGRNRVLLEFGFERASGRQRISAHDILNQGEKSLVGLSWFLAAYLLAGRAYSSTLVLDDPFQHLDETNICSFLRVLDLLDRIFSIKQIIVTLHERDIYEQLLRLWAVIPSRPVAPTEFDKTTNSVILRHNESFTSTIQEYWYQSRGEPVPLKRMVRITPTKPKRSTVQLSVSF